MIVKILGNSVIRGMSIDGVEVISVSGLNFEQSVKYLVDNRQKFYNVHVFIMIGPLRFTSKHESRGEVVLLTQI